MKNINTRFIEINQLKYNSDGMYEVFITNYRRAPGRMTQEYTATEERVKTIIGLVKPESIYHVFRDGKITICGVYP